MEHKRLRELQKEVRGESKEAGEARKVLITRELDTLQAMYEEYRLKGRIEREEGVEVEREWAI